MYGEDVDLSYRIKLAGYKNYYFPKARILHYKGESTKKGSLNYVKVFYQAMIIFANKHFGGAHKKGFILAIRMAVYARAIAAVLYRVIKKAGFPIIEGTMIYGIFYGIQEYWEHYVKYIEGNDGQYPDELVYLYMPLYAILFVIYLLLAGAYKKPFKLKPVVLAPFWGFITIATLTYFFSFIKNYSRAIVGLSSVFTMILGIGLRGLINWRKRSTFFFTESPQKQLLLSGTAEGIKDATYLIKHILDYPAQILGTVDIQEPIHEASLGNIHDLKELVELYRVDELVIAHKGVPTQLILDQLAPMYQKGITVKILPPDTHFLIGPHEIVLPEEEKSKQWKIIQQPYTRQKRVFEWMSCSLLLILWPVSFWAYHKPIKAPGELFNILRGKKHLVAYDQQTSEHLPSLKEGVLSPLSPAKRSEGLSPSAANTLYARNYEWSWDARILIRAWRKIGKR